MASRPCSNDIAAAVWDYGIRNGFGDTVQARQILTAGEKRTADAQQALAALAGQIAKLCSGGVDAAAITHAVGDALAARGRNDPAAGPPTGPGGPSARYADPGGLPTTQPSRGGDHHLLAKILISIGALPTPAS